MSTGLSPSNTQKKTCFVGLGSNLGESFVVLQEAWQRLAGTAGIEAERLSSPYRTSPVGMESENCFINCVGMLHTDREPLDLLKILLQIEADFGRKRQSSTGYQDRILDLDLLYYGDLCQVSTQLTLPHPHIAKRLFVLTPLTEICQQWRDPECRLTVLEMEKRLKKLIDTEQVARQFIEMIDWKS